MLSENAKVDMDQDPSPVDVPFLLPHELLDALHEAGELQAGIKLNQVYTRLDFGDVQINFPFYVFWSSSQEHPKKTLKIFTTLQFGRSMTGHRNRAGIAAFWKHCCSLDEWRTHPHLQNQELFGSFWTEFVASFMQKYGNKRIGFGPSTTLDNLSRYSAAFQKSSLSYVAI